MDDLWPPEAIQELLKIAGVLDSPTARAALEDALGWADIISGDLCDEQRPVPRDLYEKTAAAAHKLLNLVAELERHWRRRSGFWLKDVRVAASEIQRIQAAAEEAATQPRKSGRPEREDRLAVVVMAARFLQKHSTVKQSMDPGSTFTLFVERFWEVVTGTSSEPGLEHQIRQTIDLTRAGKLWS